MSNEEFTGAAWQDCLARAKAGDPQAVERLLETHRGWLRAAARRKGPTGGAADESDLAQETLIAAHRGIDGFQGQTPQTFRSWLMGILTNLTRMRFRSRARREQRITSLPETSSGQVLMCDEQRSLGSVVADRDESRRQCSLLEQAIAELPPPERVLYESRVSQLEPVPYERLAEELGDTPENLRQRFHRMLRRLAARLQELNA